MRLFKKFKFKSVPPRLQSLAVYFGEQTTLGTLNASGEIEIQTLDGDETVPQALSRWREAYGKTFDNNNTEYLTVVTDFSESTKELFLPKEAPPATAPEIGSWLVEAEEQEVYGADGQPLFERSLEQYAACLSLSESNSTALTEASRESVAAAVTKLLSSDSQTELANLPPYLQPQLALNIETPARAAARAFLSKQENLPSGELFVFVLATASGNTIAFWEKSKGFCFEAPAKFNPLDVAEVTAGEANGFILDGLNLGNLGVLASQASVAPETEIAQFIVKRLKKYLTAENISKYGADRVNKIILFTEETLAAAVHKEVAEYALRYKIPVSAPQHLGSAICSGLLAETILIPPINLAYDLLIVANADKTQAELVADLTAARRKTSVVIALLLPFVLCAGILGGLYLNETRHGFELAAQNSRLKNEQARLAPITAARKSYEANLKWYQDYLSQIVALWKRQGTALKFLADLNEIYPLAADDSFYVSDLKLLSNGNIDIRGLTKQEQAVTAFVRSLEVAGWVNTEKNTPEPTQLFSNLTFEIGQGIKLSGNNQTPIAQSALPSAPGIANSGFVSANLPPGVVGWKVNGVYAPVAALPPLAKTAPAPAQQVSSPAAANSSGNNTAAPQIAAPNKPAAPANAPAAPANQPSTPKPTNGVN